MLKNLFKAVCALLVAFSAMPANAAGIAPPSYAFRLVGGGNLVNGSAIWACQWNLKMETGTSVGGSPPRASGGSLLSGTGHTNPNCTLLTVAASTFTITSSTASGGTGTVASLIFYNSGSLYCFGSNVPFTFTNNPNGKATWFFNSAAVGSCNFNANLEAAADLSVVP